MEQGLIRHLILKGMTFNAESKQDPIIIRPVEAEKLVSAVIDYIERGQLPSKLAE